MQTSPFTIPSRSFTRQTGALIGVARRRSQPRHRPHPWIVHWELFCNEPNDGTKPDRRVRKMEELKGFWYVRPDGSLGWGASYLDRSTPTRRRQAAYSLSMNERI